MHVSDRKKPEFHFFHVPIFGYCPNEAQPYDLKQQLALFGSLCRVRKGTGSQSVVVCGAKYFEGES